MLGVGISLKLSVAILEVLRTRSSRKPAIQVVLQPVFLSAQEVAFNTDMLHAYLTG